MNLQTQWSTWRAGAETVRVFLARPVVSEPIPAVVVIQEVWGVDDHIEDLVARYATAGYYAVAPDLYATDGRRPAALANDRVKTVVRLLDALPPTAWSDAAARDAGVDRLPAGERADARETMGLLLNPDRPIDRYLSLLRAACVALRQDPACTGRIGSVGYCFGGLLSARLAGVEPELGAAVIYYGMSPDLALLPDLRCPLLGFYGEADVRITSGVPAFADALRREGKQFESHIYPKAPHAFFNDTRPAYRVDAARDAWARTLTFFANELSGS